MRMLMVFAASTVCIGLAMPAAAQTPAAAASTSVPDVRLSPSPSGQSAVQVGGTWQTVDGGPRYTGGKWIVVDYSRPLLRGRRHIFGSGADYGKVVSDGAPVWRAGANATTTLTTQVPLGIGGKTVAPGVYNVFVDLQPGNWTLILTNQERQARYDPNDKVKLYGAYNYDPRFDVARAGMGTVQRDDTVRQEQPVEQFTITFLTVSPKMLLLRMEWESTVATVPIELVP